MLSKFRTTAVEVLLCLIALLLAGNLFQKAAGAPGPVKMVVVSGVSPGEPIRIPDGYHIATVLPCYGDATVGFTFGSGRGLCLITEPK